MTLTEFFNNPRICRTAPESSEDFYRLMLQHQQTYKKMPKLEGHFDRVEYSDNDERTIIVAFSGGVKSLATVFFYKDLGYKVICAYAQSSEEATKAVEQLTEKLEVTLVRLPNKYKKSVLSNILVANDCIDFALENGLPLNIAFGSLSNCDALSNNWKSQACNTTQMWSAYEKIVSDTINGEFKIRRPYPAYDFVWEKILPHKSYLDLVCTSDNALLYVVRSDSKQITPVWQKYKLYIDHIWREYEKISGDTIKDYRELFKKCFFYNIEKSFYRGELESLCN